MKGMANERMTSCPIKIHQHPRRLCSHGACLSGETPIAVHSVPSQCSCYNTALNSKAIRVQSAAQQSLAAKPYIRPLLSRQADLDDFEALG